MSLRQNWSVKSGAEVIDLISPHSYKDCASILESAVGSTLVIGQSGVLKGNFWFQAYPKIIRRNAFRPCLFVTLLEAESATDVRCRFSFHPFVGLFTAIWFGGLGFAVWRIAETSQPWSTKVIFLSFCLAMAIFCIAIIANARSLAEGDRQELLSFIKMRLDVR